MDPGLRLALVATTGAGKVLLDGRAADGRAVRSWAVLAGAGMVEWRAWAAIGGLAGDDNFFFFYLRSGQARRAGSERQACLPAVSRRTADRASDLAGARAQLLHHPYVRHVIALMYLWHPRKTALPGRAMPSSNTAAHAVKEASKATSQPCGTLPSLLAPAQALR